MLGNPCDQDYGNWGDCFFSELILEIPNLALAGRG
jgi:hypothetical protein